MFSVSSTKLGIPPGGADVKPAEPVPSVEELLNHISSSDAEDKSAAASEESEREFKQEYSSAGVKQQYEYAHLLGIEDHYAHKGRWSHFLMGLIGGMIVFQSVIILMVGFEILDFSKYDWLLQMLLVQNLAQVIGLAVYAVRYLFSDISNQRVSKP